MSPAWSVRQTNPVPTGRDLLGAAWHGGLLRAVGAGGTVVSSRFPYRDWDVTILPGEPLLRSTDIEAGGYGVTVGGSRPAGREGRVFFEDQRGAWNLATLPAKCPSLHAVMWDPHWGWLAVGDDATVLHSEDTRVWKSRDRPFPQGASVRLRAITVWNDRLVVAGDGGWFAYRRIDQEAWQCGRLSLPADFLGLEPMEQSLRCLVACDTAPADAPSRIQHFFARWEPPSVSLTSIEDCKGEWPSASDRIRWRVTSPEGIFSVGDRGLILLSAGDGSATRQLSEGPTEDLVRVDWEGGRFRVETDSGRILTSLDGRTWQREGTSAVRGAKAAPPSAGYPFQLSTAVVTASARSETHLGVLSQRELLLSSDNNRWERVVLPDVMADLASDGELFFAVGLAGGACVIEAVA